MTDKSRKKEEVPKTEEVVEEVQVDPLAEANAKAEELTVKRLTKGNETMKELFREAGIDPN